MSEVAKRVIFQKVAANTKLEKTKMCAESESIQALISLTVGMFHRIVGSHWTFAPYQ